VHVDSEISPWSQAGETASPTEPTIAELDYIYRQVVDSVDKRDYEAFKNYASSERIWHTENPKKVVNEAATGELVFELLEPRGKENFEKYSPYSILYESPGIQNIKPLKVIDKEPSTRPDTILLEPKTGETTKVSMTLWKYSVDLQYITNTDYPDQGLGYVGFVWDSGSWKYNGEYWDLVGHTLPLELGEVSDEASAVIGTKNGECSPNPVQIFSGDTVVWEGVKGRIFSIQPTLENWDSGFLQGDKYYKKFNSPGIYSYLIQDITRLPEEAKDCRIEVK
jgi:hypothetical protein